MLSVSEFAQMCQLPPQTLRFYHSRGLLVPSTVDERTGYRSYDFEQVEQAMVVATLRRAGLSVTDVRRAVDDPDLAPAMLRDRIADVARQRREEDEAIADARVLVGDRPEVVRRTLPAATVLSALVPGAPVVISGKGQERWFDWSTDGVLFDDAVRRLTGIAAAAGRTVTGAPWRTPAVETDAQKRAAITAEGPHWLVKLPVDGEPTDLPADVEVQGNPALDALVVRLPGRNTGAKYATALSLLTRHPLQDGYVDLGRPRVISHDDAIEVAVEVLPLDDGDV